MEISRKLEASIRYFLQTMHFYFKCCHVFKVMYMYMHHIIIPEQIPKHLHACILAYAYLPVTLVSGSLAPSKTVNTTAKKVNQQVVNQSQDSSEEAFSQVTCIFKEATVWYFSLAWKYL